MKIKVCEELKNLIPPLQEEERNLLEELILRDGCRDALVVWPQEGELVLLDGHNRYSICKKHGIEFNTTEINLNDLDQAKDWIDANQLGRRNLTLDQRRIIIGRRYNREKKQGKRTDLTSGQNGHKLPTSEKLADEYNTTPRTVRRYAKEAEKFEQIEKEKPELARDIWAGEKTLKDVKKEEIKQRREKIRQELDQKTLEVKDKKYRILLADPPWKYGNAMPEYVTEPQDYYLLMDTEEIANMPIKEISEENSVLFLWSTSPHLPEALYVAKEWGFKYKSMFVWDKIKHNMGHYNSVRHELLLICTRGACTPDVKKLFDSVVSIERTTHSKKPDKFREIIETIYTYGNKIELFAREAPDGWDVFGNEVENV